MSRNVTPYHRPPTQTVQSDIIYSPALLHALQEQSESLSPSQLPYLPRSIIKEARHIAELMKARYLAPPSPQRLRDFVTELLEILNSIVRDPTDSRALFVRIDITVKILSAIPGHVLCDAFQRLCYAQYTTLPAPADILSMAEQYAQPYYDKIAQLELMNTFDRIKIYTLGFNPPEEDESHPSTPVSVFNRKKNVITGKFPACRQKEMSL
ncbi:hypothetical protein PT277_04480 [Acetobacteraceae bacterium ESL0709]|nr:hypothetical protein [Acetobacteraceae bacterium ESL0697]MDF7677953.1 hypothetical protein [Acetobacteraceae bacterium ESL0709]